jgi:hypothetical protein
VNTPTISSSVRVVNNSRNNRKITKKYECTDCHYALYPNTGRCTNSECPRYKRTGVAMTSDQLLHEFAPPRLFHGRRWGGWVLDSERLALVYDAEPVMRGRGDEKYVAFYGRYEINVERICQSSQVLDWICQIRGKRWATSIAMRDLIEAFDDIFALQANFCSFGSNKIIGNPTAFLKCRIATVGNDGPQQDAV